MEEKVSVNISLTGYFNIAVIKKLPIIIFPVVKNYILNLFLITFDPFLYQLLSDIREIPNCSVKFGQFLVYHIAYFTCRFRNRELEDLFWFYFKEITSNDFREIGIVFYVLSIKIDSGKLCRERCNINSPKLGYQFFMVSLARNFHLVIGSD